MNNTQKTVKRWFDIAVSVVCLVVFSPLFLYCYILIRNEDGGPAIFSQERIGMHGKPFFIYKFRSMKVDAENNEPALACPANDDRLTKAGAFLREHHLDKLIGFAMPLADALGGKEGLLYLINSGKVEIVPLAHVRGRDFKNSCIMVSEAENLTKEHIQLLVGRVGEGSTLYLDGDVRQTDKNVFEKNNGIIEAVNRLKGNRLFGYVELQKTERSETAALADLFDD